MIDCNEPLEVYRQEDPARFQDLKGPVWLRNSLGIKTSNFGARVAHLLDRLAGGIECLSLGALERVRWDDDQFIEVIWYGPLETYHPDSLTRLVLLCHELSIRAKLIPFSGECLRVEFSRRIRNGGLLDGHPTIHRALMAFDREGREVRCG